MTIYRRPGCSCRSVVEIVANRAERRRLKRLTGRAAAPTVLLHDRDCPAVAIGNRQPRRLGTVTKEQSHG